METIFWAYLLSSTGRHDRRAYFEEHKQLIDFHDWLEDVRKKLEEEKNEGVVIQNMGVITQKKL